MLDGVKRCAAGSDSKGESPQQSDCSICHQLTSSSTPEHKIRSRQTFCQCQQNKITPHSHMYGALRCQTQWRSHKKQWRLREHDDTSWKGRIKQLHKTQDWDWGLDRDLPVASVRSLLYIFLCYSPAQSCSGGRAISQHVLETSACVCLYLISYSMQQSGELWKMADRTNPVFDWQMKGLVKRFFFFARTIIQAGNFFFNFNNLLCSQQTALYSKNQINSGARWSLLNRSLWHHKSTWVCKNKTSLAVPSVHAATLKQETERKVIEAEDEQRPPS